MSLNTPDYLGVITQGQREPDAFPAVPLSGHQGRIMQTWERLRKDCDTPNMEGYEVPELAKKSFAAALMDYLYTDIEQLWDGPDCRNPVTPDSVAYAVGSRFSEICQLYNSNGITSPIEHQLGPALLFINVDWSGFPVVDLFNGPEDGPHETTDTLRFWLTPQAKIKNYKVDFLLWFAMGRHKGGVSIECDGHAFHEKTKEQAARDKKRDRELFAAGFPVMRFSGSEIYKDPIACAQSITEVLPDILFRVSKDGGLF